MSASPSRQVNFDMERARAAVLRYQPASNWLSISRDPTPRMTIGLGFDVSRPEAPEMLRQVGLDPGAVRAGRTPVSDTQMNELFDLTLLAAMRLARQRVAGFDEMPPDRQRAVLELLVWLGPEGSLGVFGELLELSLPLTDQPLEPAPWFDSVPEPNSSEPMNVPAPATRRTDESAGDRPAGDRPFGELPADVRAVLELVQHDHGNRAARFWSAVTEQRWMDAQFELRGLAPPEEPFARYTPQADALERAVRAGLLDDVRSERDQPTPGERSVPVSAVRCETTFEAFGFVAQLVSDDPDLLRAALAMLPPGWRAVDDQPSAQFGLWADGLITVDGARADLVPDRAVSLLKLGAIIRHHLATEASAFTFVHAGVVDVDGCGIVIPGRSFTGKSTLVAELVRLGAKYLSDEYAVLDPSGLVRPFAKPLSIRTGRHDRLGELVPVPQALVADHPVRAGLIVLTSYAPGSQWCPSVHSPAEGAFALLQNTVSARRRPGSALSATTRLSGEAVVLAGRRGEARETARALLEAALSDAGGPTTFPA